MKKSQNLLGFTLIELLVVISIIGILAALGTARYAMIEKSTRDAQRKSDLNQYRAALETYASLNGSNYPIASGNTNDGLCNTGSPAFKTQYLSGACLLDPFNNTTYYYRYYSDGINYVLVAYMEVSQAGKQYYEICSNGRSGYVTSAPTNSVCNL